MCSNIHKEFGYHVKPLSSDSITNSELDLVKENGNKKSRDIYLSKWTETVHPTPQPLEEKKIREFIKLKYVDKKWASSGHCPKPQCDSTFTDMENKIRRSINLPPPPIIKPEMSFNDRKSETRPTIATEFGMNKPSPVLNPLHLYDNGNGAKYAPLPNTTSPSNNGRPFNPFRTENMYFQESRTKETPTSEYKDQNSYLKERATFYQKMELEKPKVRSPPKSIHDTKKTLPSSSKPSMLLLESDYNAPKVNPFSASGSTSSNSQSSLNSSSGLSYSSSSSYQFHSHSKQQILSLPPTEVGLFNDLMPGSSMTDIPIAQNVQCQQNLHASSSSFQQQSSFAQPDMYPQQQYSMNNGLMYQPDILNQSMSFQPQQQQQQHNYLYNQQQQLFNSQSSFQQPQYQQQQQPQYQQQQPLYQQPTQQSYLNQSQSNYLQQSSSSTNNSLVTSDYFNFDPLTIKDAEPVFPAPPMAFESGNLLDFDEEQNNAWRDAENKKRQFLKDHELALQLQKEEMKTLETQSPVSITTPTRSSSTDLKKSSSHVRANSNPHFGSPPTSSQSNRSKTSDYSNKNDHGRDRSKSYPMSPPVWIPEPRKKRFSFRRKSKPTGLNYTSKDFKSEFESDFDYKGHEIVESHYKEQKEKKMEDEEVEHDEESPKSTKEQKSMILFGMTECAECGESIGINQYTHHKNAECLFRQTRCNYCNKLVKFIQMG
ncbi:hypothetical protein SAMD00019534_033230 [Acytostelium subglobosum LB1]|uniref:hypothetical protein n=1 Tax=Acytostelium subglobosum LB1 TaxID=1410327 RepID=UPI000644B826|nr:hypothetical protein SAMD00019534_033230 [Acytostelium subglobosum LB1]GAM20148.1 hypothetical protein SAMD00019534_033230 [Acytostelium subglobosum LB1]|eukprot:XP_012759669.1 hypothetical protein SAMD00019534_033230 [Acytostelium subglobosum LB1]